ncbi:MAG: hypothetical protein KatS3mg111_0625 [Pirellulaceae bacterium]|nr:MAG: hypothetical protein KatS3mg111_0625 [Pirellulaceae bacterium]
MENARDRLVAWLHDPPDKALEIRGHEARAARYLTVALGDEVTTDELRHHLGDQRASATERLAAPRWDADNRATLVTRDCLEVKHPLSGESLDGPWIERLRGLAIDEAVVQRAIAGLVDGVADTTQRWWLLWRFLPEVLERQIPGSLLLPADSRIPDHTIWQHLDTAVAMDVAYGDREGPALVSFSVGPVQSFIASARSVRDLWSGSMLLSWLTFSAALAVVELYGPTALVYPSLRGNPLLDVWLRDAVELGDRVPLPSPVQRMTPSLPNRFIALVPATDAERVARSIELRARDAWEEIADKVHDEIAKVAASLDPDWDRHWQRPIEGQFDFRTAVLPWRATGDEVLSRWLTGQSDFAAAFPRTAKVRQLAELIPEADRVGAGGSIVGQWQHRLELLGRINEADKMLRHVPAGSVARDTPVPPMCALTGETEQVGPAVLRQAAEFWGRLTTGLRIGGVRLRDGERLGPVALVKRFCGPVWFSEELGFDDPRQLRFDDTATVAAMPWLQRAAQRSDGFDFRSWQNGDGWSGQWLHRESVEDEDAECPPDLAAIIRRLTGSDVLGRPPSYYGVLALDGDRLGQWLQGELSPPVEALLHPAMRDYFESVAKRQGMVAEGLRQPRPVTPAFHASLSQALANFSLYFVPAIVRRHLGTLIYAGGDDVLALLPASTVLACAAELEEVYRSQWRRDESGATRLLMGRRATVSAGVAVVHYKDDLRRALNLARDAEHQAKEGGRDALHWTVARRSGERTQVRCPWSFVSRINRWVDWFAGGLSDRWAYQLRRLVPTMAGLDQAAITALVRRQIERAEWGSGAGGSNIPEQKEEVVADFVEGWNEFCRLTDRQLTVPQQIEQFVILCQSASFIARGSD